MHNHTVVNYIPERENYILLVLFLCGACPQAKIVPPWVGEHPDVFNDPSFSLTAMQTTTDSFPMDISEGMDHMPGLVPENPAAAMLDVRQQPVEQVPSAGPIPASVAGAVGFPVIARGGTCAPSLHIPKAVLIIIPYLSLILVR